MVEYVDRLNSVIDKFSAGRAGEFVPCDIDRAAYEGKIPPAMFDLWDAVGAGPVFDGYFQLCNPNEYQGIIALVLEGDPEIDPGRTFAVGMSAFGEIVAWNEKYRDVRIDLVNSQVTCRQLFNPRPNVDPNVSILSRLLLADDASFDVPDGNGKGLFKSARVKRGKLATGQIYGFRPILAFGGSRSVDNIEVYPASPHMAILAQATSFHLLDVSAYPPKMTRVIGG
jgi:hypothetical protein